MLTITQIDEYLRVAGYPDGGDWWILLPHGRRDFSYGVAGAAHVWYGERTGRVHLIDALGRRDLATVQLEGQWPNGFVLPLPVTVSRDGRMLFVLGPIGQGQGRVHVIDVSAGRVVAVHGPLPARLGGRPLERADGRLLLPTHHQSLVLLDLTTGTWTESAVPGQAGAANFWTDGSPDGRYWIRFDAAALPVHETTPGLLERLRGAKTKPERRYGVTIQIWEAFPLRFVRRAVAAWLTAKELPDETHLARAKSRPAALPSRRALWDGIAAARATSGAPFEVPPPRSAYSAALAADDAAWDVVEKNLARLEGWIEFAGWQPDEAAFWVTTNGFLSCVGVDGAVSPRLYTERLGLEAGTWLPVAARWRDLVPLAGRMARVNYSSGTAMFDGRPQTHPYAPQAISPARDEWQPSDRLAQERASYERLELLREERRRLVIPLGGWSEAACVAAIDALTKQINADFPRRAVNRAIRIVFASHEGEVDEERFFTEVEARFHGVTPAIRRLIDRYCNVAEGKDFLFSRGEQGIGVFAWAVKALGVLDPAALPLLRRYGVFVDPEHEHYFAGTTVPAVVKAHGWTDDVVDFVFWVLVWDFYNTLDDYGKVWNAWGLRGAVIHREPRAFARHIAVQLHETIRMKDDPGRYGVGGLDKLAMQIPQPHEPWAATFFNELERIFAEQASGEG